MVADSDNLIDAAWGPLTPFESPEPGLPTESLRFQTGGPYAQVALRRSGDWRVR